MTNAADVFRILVINPGSTSTKISLFNNTDEELTQSVHHGTGELSSYSCILEQADFRERTVRRFMSENGLRPHVLSAVIGRGGLLRPIESGVYRVSEAMINDLSSARFGEHASNLGGIIASRLAKDAGCDAYIADPVVVDELDDIVRLSGIPEIARRSVFHALNQRSAAREAAMRHGWKYEDVNLIVAHLGGGISVGAHRRGRVVDVNNALDGDGPFSPERAGSLPAGQLVTLVLGGTLSESELRKRLTGHGGMVAYCGTNDLDAVLSLADSGDSKARLVFEAMAYQTSKEIAMHGATLSGKVDLIVLTGGMANNRTFTDLVSSRVSFLAPIEIVPGEREMISLARAAFSVLAGETEARTY